MLPTIVTPDFETTIPSTGQTIRYRPFLVKEEKKLLMAMESKEESSIINAVNDILKECILDDIDVNQLSFFDFEYLFLQIRMKSVGEIVEFGLTHECGQVNDITLNLEEVKVQGNIDTTVMLNDTIGVKMRYPNVRDINKLADQSVESLLNLFCDCVVSVFDSDQIYDFEKKELKEWIEQLPQESARKMVAFFSDMPKLKHDLTYKCSKCGEEHNQTLEGLQSFFR